LFHVEQSGSSVTSEMLVYPDRVLPCSPFVSFRMFHVEHFRRAGQFWARDVSLRAKNPSSFRPANRLSFGAACHSELPSEESLSPQPSQIPERSFGQSLRMTRELYTAPQYDLAAVEHFRSASQAEMFHVEHFCLGALAPNSSRIPQRRL